MLRNSWLLALFALFALSAAFNLNDIDGIEDYLHHGKRQAASGTGGGNTPASSAAPPASSAAPPPRSSAAPPPAQSSVQPVTTTTRDSTPDPVTSNRPAASTPAPAPASSQGQGQNTPTQRSSAAGAPAESSKAPVSSVRTQLTTRTTPLVSTSLQPFTTTYTSTRSDGTAVEVTMTGTSSVPITTGQAIFTEPATSQPNNDSSSSLSESNKKVIGGVVGGIGGALLLGGIALVFWRMKKRQHKVTADDDDLNLNTGAALGDKPQNGTGASPFQSNLEQYHNPGARPNAAANF
jgi:hypothetical protein